MRKTTAVMILILMLVTRAHGYGQKGHTTVGAIADGLLKGKPAAAKVTELLDGLTLAEASIIPDKIKDWDKGGPNSTEVFHLPAHPKIEAALLAFWEANPPKKNDPKTRPSHHWFHYTDVPVEGDEKYSDGKIGRQQWDIVHMISYCIKVLDGSEPEDNARKITKPVAVILLAHYLGDIHQPLHVGAEFFGADGKPTHPTDESKAAEDQGGNTIFLLDVPDTEGRRGEPGPRLHAFWDDDVVDAAYKQISDDINPDAKRNVSTKKVVEYLVEHEPKDWKPAAKSKPVDWAEAWANEILPIAKEAHARLIFSDITIEKDHGGLLARGNAKPREMPDKIPYKEWAGKVVRAELHKGGWQLAELLERVVK